MAASNKGDGHRGKRKLRSTCFFVNRVLATGRTELAQFNTVWVVAAVLAGYVVTSLAVATGECDLWTNI